MVCAVVCAVVEENDVLTCAARWRRMIFNANKRLVGFGDFRPSAQKLAKGTPPPPTQGFPT
jgi:hypothetical protein